MIARAGHRENPDRRNEAQNAQQQLSFLNQPSDKIMSTRGRTVKSHGGRYLQNVLWKESLLAVKVSLSCQTVAELVSRLQEKLPQNSAATRRRNASVILGRFFPTDDLAQLPRRVLQAYEDEALLADVMRVLFLQAEPVIGKLVAERLFSLPPGTELSKDFFSRYAQEVLGKKDANVSYRCCTAARVLGWIATEKNKFYVAQQILDETAALLIFHHRYAPTPRVIDVKLLLSEPFWKYLGYRTEDAVREFMRKLEKRGLVSRILFRVHGLLSQSTEGCAPTCAWSDWASMFITPSLPASARDGSVFARLA